MKKFKWLGATCHPRRGVKLVKGQVYDVECFSKAVVDNWIGTKNAQYVKVEPETKSSKNIKMEVDK